MDALSYILFKNPVVSYSSGAVKSVASSISGILRASTSSSTSPPAITLTKSLLQDMIPLMRNYLRLAGIFGASAVIIGAYGAHTLLAHETDEHRKNVFKTASEYHFYHTLAFVAIPFCRFPKLSALTMASGIIIFCGSCYYQSLTGDNAPRKITPYGGSLLILAWLSMLL